MYLILQILFALLFSLLIYVLSVKITCDKLDGSAEAARLGAGIAKVIVGLLGYAVSGADLCMRELWRDVESGTWWIYCLVRWGMMVVAIIGIIQCALAIFAKCEKVRRELASHTHKELEEKKGTLDYTRTPAWKKVQEG